MINWHEQRNREIKIAALVRVIDEHIGPGAHEVPDAVHRFLADMTREQWKDLAILAKVIPPTWRHGISETVRQVLAVYSWRAEKLRRRNPATIVTPLRKQS